jgi:outer membrane protein TolC
MKTKISILATFVAINSYAITFNQAYQTVINSNSKLSEKEFIYKSSQQSIDKAKSQLLPQVTFKSTLQRENIDSSSIGDIRLSNNKINSITITTPIYNIALDNEVKKAKYTSNIRELEHQQSQQKLVLELAQKYLPWLNLIQQQDLAVKNLEFLQQYNKKMQKLAQLNLISQGDLLESQSLLFEAKLQEKFAKNTYEKSKKSLEFFLKRNIREHKSLKLNIEPIENFFEKNSLEKFILELNNNLDLSITNLEKKIKYTEYDTQKKSFYPKIDFSADLSKTSRDNDTFYNRYSGQIVLSMPLYTSGYNTASKQEAQYMYLSTKEKEQYLKDDLQYSITQTYIELRRIINQYKTSIYKIESLKEKLKFAKQAHKFGIQELQEILNIEKEIITIKLEKIDTLEKIITNYIDINYFISKIDSKLIDNISKVFEFKY